MNIRRDSFFFLPEGKTFRQNVGRRKKKLEKPKSLEKYMRNLRENHQYAYEYPEKL